jgi:hypothetical protein
MKKITLLLAAFFLCSSHTLLFAPNATKRAQKKARQKEKEREEAKEREEEERVRTKNLAIIREELIARLEVTKRQQKSGDPLDAPRTVQERREFKKESHRTSRLMQLFEPPAHLRAGFPDKPA